MTNHSDDDSVARALRLGLRSGRAAEDGEALPLEGAEALALAAYLDGTLTAAEQAEVEAGLLCETGRLEVLLAGRAALAAEPAEAAPLPSEAVVQRAQALVAERQDARRPSKIGAWLQDLFARPLRPALGAAAFALYGLFCLQVFDWGLAGGEVLAAATAAEAAPAEASFALALDDLL